MGNVVNNSNSLDYILAFNVRHFRILNGVSQATLADRIGISRGYIADIENNRRNPQMSKVFKIADALRVPAWMLVKPLMEENMEVTYEQEIL